MVTIKITELTEQSKALIKFLETLPYVEIDYSEYPKIPNSVTIQAINDVKKGNTKKLKDFNDLISE